MTFLQTSQTILQFLLVFWKHHEAMIDSIESVLIHVKLLTYKCLDVFKFIGQVIRHDGPHTLIQMERQEFMVHFLLSPLLHNFGKQFRAVKGQKLYCQLEVCLFWLVWDFIFRYCFQQVVQSGSLLLFDSKQLFALQLIDLINLYETFNCLFDSVLFRFLRVLLFIRVFHIVDDLQQTKATAEESRLKNLEVI